MKKIIKHLYKAVLCFTAISLSSCSEVFDNTWTASEMNQSLSLPNSTLAFTSDAQSKTFGVQAENMPWALQNNALWLTLSPNSGNHSVDVTASVLANTSDTARTSNVQLVSTDPNIPRSYNLTVSQSAPVSYIQFSENSLVFDGGASEQQVTVTSNREWTYSASQSWISLSRSGNTLTISVSANDGDKAREGYVNVSAGNINKQIPVTQRTSNVSATITSLSFGSSASSETVVINSDAAWTADCSQSWIDITPQSGVAGQTTMTVSVTANPSDVTRKGFVYINIGNTRRLEIAITQDGSYLSVSPTELNFGNEASSQQIEIEANTQWSLSTDDKWIHLNKTSGTGNATVTVSVDKNSNEQRLGTINLLDKSGNRVNYVIVKQDLVYMNVSSTSLSFTNEASTLSLTISANAEWTAQAGASWITLDRSSGKGDASLNVSVGQNTTDTSRSSEVVLACGSITRVVRVSQSGHAELSCTPSFISFPVDGGTADLNITSNTSWLLKSSESWLTLSAKNGNGNAKVTLKASVNSNASVRTTSIQLQNANGETVQTIGVTQTALSLSASLSQTTFEYSGGSATLTILSNASWRVETPSWMYCSVSSGSGNGSIGVNIEGNDNTISRKGDIIVFDSSNSEACRITVGQNGRPDIQDFTRDLGHVFASKGESLRITSFEKESSWQAEVVDGKSWITLSSASGDSNEDLVITTADNPSGNQRTGKIQITYGYHRYTCSVVQYGKTITVSTNVVDFFAKGGTSGAVTITADKIATISNTANWLTIDKGGNIFTVKADKNTSSESRMAKLTIMLPGVIDSPSVTVTVRQAGVDGTFVFGEFDDDENWNQR